jgi:hypothetical protein
MNQFSSFLDNEAPLNTLPNEAASFALAQTLAGQLLRGESVSSAPDLKACDAIFARLAQEPVLLAPALARQNSLLLKSPVEPKAPVESANEPNWKAWTIAASLSCVALVVGFTSRGLLEQTQIASPLVNLSPPQLAITPASQPSPEQLALQAYLKAHREAQAAHPAPAANSNPYIQNAAIRVTY